MKHGFVIPLIAVSLLLSGCWSSAPIEDLNMEVGVALDSGEETEIETKFEQEGGNYPKQNKLSCTYQFIVPSEGTGSKRGGAQSKKYYNMTETGDSIFEAVREISLRTDRTPIGHHLKNIVIGEKLARSMKLSELIDFFSRDNDIRPSVLLMVSKGRARDVLENALPGQVPSFVLQGIFNNRNRNSRIWESLSMAKAVGLLHGKQSFLMQNVIAAGKEPKFAGAGVFSGKTGKLIGFLNETELEGAVWLTGKGTGGVIKTHNPENGKLITYEVKSMKSKIRSKAAGEKISFHVLIESTGRFAEAFSPTSKKLNDALIEEAEQVLQKDLETLVQNTVNKLQHELHADAVGFGENLHIQHPGIWNKVKDDWDETFSHLPVTYEVKLNIEEYGASGTTTE